MRILGVVFVRRFNAIIYPVCISIIQKQLFSSSHTFRYRSYQSYPISRTVRMLTREEPNLMLPINEGVYIEGARLSQ